MKTSLVNWLNRWCQHGVRTSRRRTKYLAACATVALARAWATPAGATVINLQVTPSESLTRSYAVFFLGNSSSLKPVFLGDLPAGHESVFDQSFPNLPIANFKGPGAGYALIGLHGSGDNVGVSVSFNSLPFEDRDGDTVTVTDVIANAIPWDTIFQFDEQGVIAGLNGGPSFTPDGFINGVRDMARVPYGTEGMLVNFSDGSFGGVAIATIPEPATWTLLVVGGAVWTVVRRRRG